MKKIYVGNLARTMTEDALEAAFTPFGEVRSVTIIRDRFSGESRGFGFVEMENDNEAQAAMTGLNGKDVGGRCLTVNEARPSERRPGGGRGGPRGGGGGGGRRDRW